MACAAANAVRDKLLSSNPLVAVRRPSVPHREAKPLEPDTDDGTFINMGEDYPSSCAMRSLQ